MIQLTTEPAQGLHLLSLLVRARVLESLATRPGQRRAASLRGLLGLNAAGMVTRLHFDGHRVHLDQGPLDEARTQATGSLAAFLALCQGKVGPVELVRGHVGVKGSPLLLIKALPLLHTGGRDA